MVPKPTLSDQYEARVAKGDLRPDPAQLQPIRLLQELADQLNAGSPRALWRWNSLWTAKRKPQRGIYLHGNVGRGKTMLMDMFYDSVAIEEKRRVHINKLLMFADEQGHKLREEDRKKTGHSRGSPLAYFTDYMAREVRLLCLDEFHAADISDTQILMRLIGDLFKAGVTIVTTSNLPLNRLFGGAEEWQRNPYLSDHVNLLRQNMVIHNVTGDKDYRLGGVQLEGSYLHPIGRQTSKQLIATFRELTGNVQPVALELPVRGRNFKVNCAANGVAYFNFDELCNRPLGRSDYLALAENFHTVFIDGVRGLYARDIERADDYLTTVGNGGPDDMQRFKNLVDTFYDSNVCLYIGASVPLEDLFVLQGRSLTFDRVFSRLSEMQTEGYAQRAAKHPQKIRLLGLAAC